MVALDSEPDESLHLELVDSAGVQTSCRLARPLGTNVAQWCIGFFQR